MSAIALLSQSGQLAIVIGTHGQTGPDRMVSLGSTTERVLKNVSTPVLVVDIE